MKFNPKNKETLTYSEALDPAMSIKNQDEADQYFKDYVNYLEGWLEKEPREDKITAEEIARTNLGYYAGYYDSETRVRVERLFNTEHPIFGKIDTLSQKVMEE